MIKENIYVYAIISTLLNSAKPEESARSMLGINNRGIMLIPYKDFVVIASNIHLDNFNNLDKEDLNEFVAAHEQVNNQLIKDFDVVPMRFGMIVKAKEDVLDILKKTYLQFKISLDKIAGKNEFIIEAFLDEKNLFEKIAQENIEIQKLREEVMSRGRILGLASKIKLGKLIFEALELRRKKYRENILGFLAIYFPDFTAGKLFDFAKDEIPNEIGKKMIMNYSFLIEKSREAELESVLNQLAKKYSAQGGSASGGKDELKFKYIGPMAPYSFVDIKLSVGNFDLIDSARKTLGLGEKVTAPEIKNAYYKLAAQYHPDKYEYKKDQAVSEEAAKKMKDIATANEALTAYCRHYLSSLSLGENQSCSLCKADVENSIIVKKY